MDISKTEGSETMDDLTLIQYMKSDYDKDLSKYKKMRDYYDGKHDIYNRDYFKPRKWTLDRRTHSNWIGKFISEEIAYALNKPVSYTSLQGNSDFEQTIKQYFEHFTLNHDQKLMRELEIYGKCYTLYYVKTYTDRLGEERIKFCERILNPTNAIAYCDDDGEVQRFIYFYKKKYDDNDYYNVYYPNGKVEIYKNNSLYKTEKHIFNRVPAHVISVEDSETLYAKIKELNDDYNELLTNQQCLINEYRNAYLGICANKQDVDEEFIKKLKLDEAGVIVYPDPQAKPSWIIKQINDTAIKNQMDEIKQNLYAQSGHIDWNEKLSSNLSGVALQSRLTGLDQRVNMMLNPIKNALYSRIYFLCDCLMLVNKIYDPADIKIEANIDIPTDTSARVNEVVQLGDIVSQQTKLERLPYVENPAIEIERIQKEKLQNAELQAKANKTAQNINLDLINEYGDTDE